MQPTDGKIIAVGITNSKASQRAVAYAATKIARPGDTVHLLCVLLDSTLADDNFARATYMRIQRIIAERFLPILDDVFVAHKTHILRTTAISGGVTCIAGILGSKSVELKASVLVVGNGVTTYLSELLFPSVAKAVVKLKRVPIAVVGPDSVRHCGAGERAGEVEPWEGGCVLQVQGSNLHRLSLAGSSSNSGGSHDRLLTRASAPVVHASLERQSQSAWHAPTRAETLGRASSWQPSSSSGAPAESLATPSTIPEADEEPRQSEQREHGQVQREACPSDQWRRLQSDAIPAVEPQEPGGSVPTGVLPAPNAVSRAV